MSAVSKSMRQLVHEDTPTFKKIQHDVSADIEFLATRVFGAIRIGIMFSQACTQSQHIYRRGQRTFSSAEIVRMRLSGAYVNSVADAGVATSA